MQRVHNSSLPLQLLLQFLIKILFHSVTTLSTARNTSIAARNTSIAARNTSVAGNLLNKYIKYGKVSTLTAWLQSLPRAIPTRTRTTEPHSR